MDEIWSTNPCYSNLAANLRSSLLGLLIHGHLFNCIYVNFDSWISYCDKNSKMYWHISISAGFRIVFSTWMELFFLFGGGKCVASAPEIASISVVIFTYICSLACSLAPLLLFIFLIHSVCNIYQQIGHPSGYSLVPFSCSHAKLPLINVISPNYHSSLNYLEGVYCQQ